MEQEYHKWLDDEEHADRWYGNEEPYSAKKRRILKTHWAGEAYTKLCENEYDDSRKKLWLKTGWYQQMGPMMIKLLLKVSKITKFPHHISI